MVYMAAQNVPGEAASLKDEAESDIEEMMKVGSTDTLNILFELHGDGDPQRCHVTGRDAKRVPVHMEPQDATNGRALAAFIQWALEKVHHEEADYSMLVLWGHAYRFGLGPTLTGQGIDAIDFAELTRVLRNCQDEFKRTYGTSSRPKLDIVVSMPAIFRRLKWLSNSVNSPSTCFPPRLASPCPAGLTIGFSIGSHDPRFG